MDECDQASIKALKHVKIAAVYNNWKFSSIEMIRAVACTQWIWWISIISILTSVLSHWVSWINESFEILANSNSFIYRAIHLYRAVNEHNWTFFRYHVSVFIAQTKNVVVVVVVFRIGFLNKRKYRSKDAVNLKSS